GGRRRQHEHPVLVRRALRARELPARTGKGDGLRCVIAIYVLMPRKSLQSVASDAAIHGKKAPWLRDAGAQEPERTRQYVRIPSTAGAQAAERSSFAAISMEQTARLISVARDCVPDRTAG